MRSILLFVTLLALTGVTLSSAYGRKVNLLKDIVSSIQQEEDDDGDVNLLEDVVSSIQQEEDDDGDVNLLEDVVSSIQQEEDDGDVNLLDDVVSSIQQEDDGDDGEGRADIETLDALINAFSSVQQDGEGGGEGGDKGGDEGGDEGGDDGGDEENDVNTQGLMTKIRKFVKTLKIIGKLAHRFAPRNKYVRKYSKYLRCLPNVQEELERATTQEDAEKEFKELLSNLEAQARSEKDTVKLQFFKKLFRKAKRIVKKVFFFFLNFL